MRLERYQDLMRRHPFVEVYRESDTVWDAKKTLRAEITPCVTVDIAVPIEPSIYDSVTYIIDYIYTCPTK